MTTTISPPATFTTALGRDVVFERTPGMGGVVRGLKVFRAGSFRDSANRPHTWSAKDLHALVSHFVALRDNGIFPHVPVRANHGRNVGDVVGYIGDLSTDGKYLIADVEITEPDAADKIERKTFRSRSLEVGAYRDNDDKVYSPTVLGMAFVDIGAVEGLFNSADSQSINFTITEQDMTTFEQSQLDWAVAAAYAKGLEDAPKPPPTSDLAPFEFSYSGQKSADPKAVQAYINTLETAQAEARDAARKTFVEDLAAQGKLPATQIEAAHGLVLTMSDSQFTAYKAIHEAAPKMSRFESHSDNGTGTGDDGITDAEQELKDLEEIVAMHRRTGLAEDDIAKTASFQKLTALKNAIK